MVRERLKEIVDFAKSESPYRNANKGWINDNIYFQWGALEKEISNDGKELLDVFLFWKPVKKLLSILFIVVLLSSAFVFTSISFSKGRLDNKLLLVSNFFDYREINDQDNLDPFLLEPVDGEIALEDQENSMDIDIVSNNIELDQSTEKGDELVKLEKNTNFVLDSQIDNEIQKRFVPSGNMLQPKAK